MTLREVVTEFCLMGDRVEALEAINDLIRAARAAALDERDAVWADAIAKLSDDCDVECIRSNVCDDADALRALLEGK